jgi:mannose-6-phosphate isomerase-like protein (cupin superfamily)
MSKLARVVAGLLVSASMFATPAMAQDKAKGKTDKSASSAPKVLLENAKVRAQELTVKPGQVNDTAATTAYRVVRVLSGAKLERTYADGKKESIERKTGEVYMLEPGPAYTFKNVGKTVFRIYVVVLK